MTMSQEELLDLVSRMALAVRDCLKKANTQEAYETLTKPHRRLIGARMKSTGINALEAAIDVANDFQSDGAPEMAGWVFAAAVDIVEETIT